MAPAALISGVCDKNIDDYGHIPHLQSVNGVPHLVVDGNPFMILGGELQNSSLSCAQYMLPIWPKLKDMNINTVLGAVTWEQIEPIEGAFDFSTLDKVIVDARSHGLRLVLLWFGSFKNGVSTYTPPWVKTNPRRFPRAQLRDGDGGLSVVDVLSVFHAENCSADAKAFRELMRHLKEIDEHHFTVIMVQVQNEVGVLGDSRDRSEAAEKAFAGPPPGGLLRKLEKNWSSLHPALKANLQQLKRRIETDKKTSSWEEAFGPGLKTNELFMAYNYAIYVESVAKAGKSEYPLPFFTNVWQNYGSADGDPNVSIVAGGGDAPGIYPSGGG